MTCCKAGMDSQALCSRTLATMVQSIPKVGKTVAGNFQSCRHCGRWFQACHPGRSENMPLYKGCIREFGGLPLEGRLEYSLFRAKYNHCNSRGLPGATNLWNDQRGKSRECIRVPPSSVFLQFYGKTLVLLQQLLCRFRSWCAGWCWAGAGNKMPALQMERLK